MAVVGFLQKNFDEPAILWARHDPPDGESHFHFVVRFAASVVWNPLREWLQSPEVDPQSQSRVGRSFARACRYLLHLDNPEKHPVPRSALNFVGITEDEVSETVGGERAPILADIVRTANMAPSDAFEYLVTQRGHKPSECSSAIRLLYELERLKRLRSGLRSTSSASVEDAYKPASDTFGPGAFVRVLDPREESWENPTFDF